MKIGGVAVWSELSGSLETFDRTGSVSLLQEGAAEFEMGKFVARQSFDHIPEQRHGVRRMALGQECVAKMISRDWIGRAKLKFGAKFLDGKFKFILVKIDKTRVIVGVRMAGIELQDGS